MMISSDEEMRECVRAWMFGRGVEIGTSRFFTGRMVDENA